jgi:hypothetical protein
VQLSWENRALRKEKEIYAGAEKMAGQPQGSHPKISNKREERSYKTG